MPTAPANSSQQHITKARTGAHKRKKMAKSDQLAICASLIVLPLILVGFKLSGLPGSTAIAHAISFEQLPHDLRTRSLHLLIAPVGALVVVFFRLTLGIRVLGPFRSVLLGVAFQVTGGLVGLAFFTLVIGVVTLLRPLFRRMRLAYFGRSAAMLSSVAGIIVLAVLVGLMLGIRDVERVAYFPVVVLTLAGDAFAAALRREGTRNAVWRAGATAGVALIIMAISSIHVLQTSLLHFPELLLAVLGMVIFVASSLKLRLLQGLNPPARKKSRAKSIVSVKPTGIPAQTPIAATPPPLAATELSTV